MDDGDPVAALRDRDPGADPADPYADVDVSTLPEWWRRAIEEFEAHGLRAYRPPRFADGALKHEVVSALEADLGVDVEVRGVDVTHGDDWTVFVDGARVGTVGRHRTPEGFTEFETTSEAFERLVRSAPGADPADR
jgi:hypothetical protein